MIDCEPFDQFPYIYSFHPALPEYFDIHPPVFSKIKPIDVDPFRNRI